MIGAIPRWSADICFCSLFFIFFYSSECRRRAWHGSSCDWQDDIDRMIFLRSFRKHFHHWREPPSSEGENKYTFIITCEWELLQIQKPAPIRLHKITRQTENNTSSNLKVTLPPVYWSSCMWPPSYTEFGTMKSKEMLNSHKFHLSCPVKKKLQNDWGSAEMLERHFEDKASLTLTELSG